jgi:hypothetical protein
MSNVKYGFVDNDNLLLEVAVFDEENTELLEQVKELYGASAYHLIDETRPPAVIRKSVWTGTYFTPGFDFPSWTWDMEKEIYVPPVAYPEDAQDGVSYSWSEEQVNWVAV